MRIIAGKAKGRRLLGPAGKATRPPTGRMRESIFSTLQGAIEDQHVLDLFAGSGSFGLESLSRGAASAVFVERDSRALRALRRNVDVVGLGGRVVAGSVIDTIGREPGPFGLVFVDPPYALDDSDISRVLGRLEGSLADNALVLVHRRRDHEQPEGAGTLTMTDRRRYGDAVVWWYIKEAN